MKVYNSSKNNIIADKADIAQNPFTRIVGLLLKKSVSENEGLVINPCNSVHTFFMRFPIDVLFVNKRNEIIACYENVKPWRILPIHLRSNYVVELCAGEISSKNIQKGDVISISN